MSSRRAGSFRYHFDAEPVSIELFRTTSSLPLSLPRVRSLGPYITGIRTSARTQLWTLRSPLLLSLQMTYRPAPMVWSRDRTTDSATLGCIGRLIIEPYSMPGMEGSTPKTKADLTSPVDLNPVPTMFASNSFPGGPGTKKLSQNQPWRSASRIFIRQPFEYFQV